MVVSAVYKPTKRYLKQQLANRYNKLAKNKGISNIEQELYNRIENVKNLDNYYTQNPELFKQMLLDAESSLQKTHAKWYMNKPILNKIKELEKQGFIPEKEVIQRKSNFYHKKHKFERDIQDILNKHILEKEPDLNYDNPAYIKAQQNKIKNNAKSASEERLLLQQLSDNKKVYENAQYNGQYEKNRDTLSKRATDLNDLTTNFLKSLDNPKDTKEQLNFSEFYKALKERLVNNSDKKDMENKALKAFKDYHLDVTDKSDLLQVLQEQEPVKNFTNKQYRQWLLDNNIRNFKKIRNLSDIKRTLNANDKTSTEKRLFQKFFQQGNAVDPETGKFINRNPANKKADYDMLRWRNQHRPEIVDLIEDEEGNVSYKLKPHNSQESEFLEGEGKRSYQEFLDLVRSMYGD